MLADQASICKIVLLEEETNEKEQDNHENMIQEVQPQEKSPKKRKGKTPLVETEIRHSPRIQLLNNGFRRESRKNKDCLPCHSKPPTIPMKTMKILHLPFVRLMTRSLMQGCERKTKLAKRKIM